MARKQNKSVKATEQDSSGSINTRKGGKVQKKLPDNKTKKKVKQAVKSQVKQNKSQTKQILPLSTGRRSSRANNDNTKNSSSPASRLTNIGKASTSSQAATSPRTSKVQSASKRKNNPVELPENKKRVSTTNSLKSKKNVTSPADKKKAGNKMSLRGKKRSYAQLASGNKIEGYASKKKKTGDSKDVTSRGNRSIKPTVKGSEWRNTILQKKSTSSKQEKTSIKARKTPLKDKSSTANKSAVKNKKTSPPKSVATTKTPKKTAIKSSKRLSGSRVSTENIQKLSPSKNKVKNPKRNSVSSKSPKGRTASKKSTKLEENGKNSPKSNTLATSIKSKFNSCVSNKRKSRDTELHENVLVAQGILHDILNSVGTPDILLSDQQSVDKGEEKLAISGTHIVPVEMLDQDEVRKDNQGIDSTQTINLPVNETKLNPNLLEERKSISISVNTDDEPRLESNHCQLNESNSDSKKNVESEINKLINVSEEVLPTRENVVKQKLNKEDEILEEMELRLSDTSAASVNDNDIRSSDDKSTVSSNNEKIKKSERCSENNHLVDSVMDFDNKLNEKLSEQENKHSEPLQTEKTSVEENDSFSGSTEASSLSNEIKESQKYSSTGKSSEDIEKNEFSSNQNVSLSLPEMFSNISGAVKENPNFPVGGTGSKDSVVSQKEGNNAVTYQQENLQNTTVSSEIGHSINNEANVIQVTNKKESVETSKVISHSEKESLGSKNHLKSKNDVLKESTEIQEIQIVSLNGELGKVENGITNEIKSNGESNLIGHQDTFNNGENTLSDLKGTTTFPIKDKSSIIHSQSLSLDKTQNEPMCKTVSEKSELTNDKLMPNGCESISSDISSQKSNGKTQDITISGDKNLLEIPQNNEEVKLNDIPVVKVNTVLESNACLPSDSVKLKESSASLTTANGKVEENLVDKNCLTNKDVSTEETTIQIGQSPNLERSKLNELNIQEMSEVDKPRVSEQLPLDPDISSPNVEEKYQTLCDAQKVDSDFITVPDQGEPLKPINEGSEPQEIGLKEHTLSLKTTSNHQPNSHVSTEKNFEETSIVRDCQEKRADGLDPPLQQIATEVCRKIPSSISSITTENDSLQHDSPEELMLKSGSLTGLTEDIKEVTLENTSSSSREYQIEEISMGEEFRPEELQANNKTDISTNLTEDINKVTLSSSSSSSHNEQISVCGDLSSKNSQNDQNVSPQTSIQKLTNCCATEVFDGDKCKTLAGSLENENTNKELLKMEQGNQEETTQDSIIVDDTDVESMQCSSETQSNRMSVDEENTAMEVDTEELAAAASTGSTIEMTMEVS